MAQRTDLIEKVIATLVDGKFVADRHAALINIANDHDRNCGLYHYAKLHNVLEEDSAAEFSCQFYTAFNAEVEHRY